MPKTKARVGPRSPFGPKSLPNRSHSMTALGKRILDAQARLKNTSESNLVEYITRTTDWNHPDLVAFFEQEQAATSAA